MSASELTKNQKIQILLQEEAHAVLQMENIKKEEMSWLKVFLLFYGAMAAWGVSRWLISPGVAALSKPEVDSEYKIIITVLLFTWAATCLFAFLFFQTRSSYYGVRRRVENIQHYLFLDQPGVFGDKAVFDGMKVEDINNRDSWKKVTRPTSSYLTRMVYLIGANFTVIIIAMLSLYKMSYPVSIMHIGMFSFMNFFILFVSWNFDYHMFTRKSE